MSNKYALRANRIVTASRLDTILEGVIIVNEGKIEKVGKYSDLYMHLNDIEVLNYGDKVITPGLVDCHTHLFEYAAGSLYPVSEATHLWAGKCLALDALSRGVTALGEQICGHPACNLSIEDYYKAVENLPMSIQFALCSITMGDGNTSHFCSLSGNKLITMEDLLNEDDIKYLAMNGSFPGENVFVTATPANLPLELVPKAGQIVYNLQQLKKITDIYHSCNKKIGAHVGGVEAIEMSIQADVDVLHHAHGITDKQIEEVARKNIMIVATPLGGSHLKPDDPKTLVKMLKKDVVVAIATDSYLPGSEQLGLDKNKLYGTDVLMKLAQPTMELMLNSGFSKSDCLKLITRNPAEVLGNHHRFGSIDEGLDANLIISNGIPGLEITDTKDIYEVFYNGIKVINRI